MWADVILFVEENSFLWLFYNKKSFTLDFYMFCCFVFPQIPMNLMVIIQKLLALPDLVDLSIDSFFQERRHSAQTWLAWHLEIWMQIQEVILPLTFCHAKCHLGMAFLTSLRSKNTFISEGCYVMISHKCFWISVSKCYFKALSRMYLFLSKNNTNVD